MTDYTKTKIGFALAFLGILFTIFSTLQNHMDVGPQYWSLTLKLSYFYYAFVSSLGLSVYLYAMAFISNRKFFKLHLVGDFTYTVAILIPTIYLFSWLIYFLGKLINIIIQKPQLISILGSIITTLFGI